MNICTCAQCPHFSFSANPAGWSLAVQGQYSRKPTPLRCRRCSGTYPTTTKVLSIPRKPCSNRTMRNQPYPGIPAGTACEATHTPGTDMRACYSMASTHPPRRKTGRLSNAGGTPNPDKTAREPSSTMPRACARRRTHQRGDQAQPTGAATRAPPNNARDPARRRKQATRSTRHQACPPTEEGHSSAIGAQCYTTTGK